MRSGFVFAAAVSLLSGAVCPAAADPPLVDPVFPLPAVEQASDYRPTLNYNAKNVVFERTLPNAGTQLYKSVLATTATAEPFTGIPGGARADWCWQQLGTAVGPGLVAFSAKEGVYVVSGTGASPHLLPQTAGMIYPTWYPDCRFLAVDVATTHVTAKLDAKSGNVVVPALGRATVWAGFPSVNRVNPNLVAFAGQNNKESNYYNQELNYTWVSDRSSGQTRLAPMDLLAPKGPAFLQKFQARAGTWSPDGRWFAFESNRACNDVSGQTYAVFIQDATGAYPAMQVTGCSWNSQHPKWFPPGTTGTRTMLIAAVAPLGQCQPFRIATLDVTAFVGGVAGSHASQ